MIGPALQRIAMAFVLVGACLHAAAEGDRAKEVDFRDIHRGGSASIIGNFGLPVGRMVRLEGTRAKPSKISNTSTLLVSKVDGRAFPKPREELRWPPYVQIANAASLPEGEDIVVEGYEFVRWRGDPEINWNIEVEFHITKVIAPDKLVLTGRQPW